MFITGTYCIAPEDEVGLEMALRKTGGVPGGIRVTEDFILLEHVRTRIAWVFIAIFKKKKDKPKN